MDIEEAQSTKPSKPLVPVAFKRDEKPRYFKFNAEFFSGSRDGEIFEKLVQSSIQSSGGLQNEVISPLLFLRAGFECFSKLRMRHADTHAFHYKGLSPIHETDFFGRKKK